MEEPQQLRDLGELTVSLADALSGLYEQASRDACLTAAATLVAAHIESQARLTATDLLVSTFDQHMIRLDETVYNAGRQR